MACGVSSRLVTLTAECDERRLARVTSRGSLGYAPAALAIPARASQPATARPARPRIIGGMTDKLDALRAMLPGARVITDPEVMDSYRRDQTPVVTPGAPACVVIAHTTADVAATLAWAQEHKVAVVPRGGGTSLAGGATATDGCVVLSTARMADPVEVDAGNEIAVAQAGVLNADLDRAAEAHGLMYAPDPSSWEISTIGGNLATNAGGLRCVKYGVTREATLGLEVVLADGRVMRTGRRTVKGVAGYDITSLFVGSEGTLGVITSATLRLRPRPSAPPTTLAASFPSFGAAARAVTAILRARLGGWPRTTAPFKLGGWGPVVNIVGLIYGGAMLINFAWPRAASNPKPNQTVIGGVQQLDFHIGFLNNIPILWTVFVVIAAIGAIYYLAVGRTKEFAPVTVPADEPVPASD